MKYSTFSKAVTAIEDAYKKNNNVNRTKTYPRQVAIDTYHIGVRKHEAEISKMYGIVTMTVAGFHWDGQLHHLFSEATTFVDVKPAKEYDET